MKVGFCGYAKVGKDTAAKALPNFHRVAFADPLKHKATMMLRSIGVSCELSDWSVPEFKERWRDLLVALGAGMRHSQENYWICECIKDMVKRGLGKQDDVAITDVRYLNEILWILEQGGIVIRIMRTDIGPANEEERRSFTEIYRWLTETSSSLQSRFYTVENNGTIELLHKRINAAIASTLANSYLIC